jgi:DegV family protein with EDD domain
MGKEPTMPKVGVVTDSCASIPEDLIAAYDIQVVPYNVHIQGRAYKDLVDLQREEFYTYLAGATEFPQTANPSPGDFLAVYRRLAETTREIISIHMTSIGSGAYQAAQVGVEMLRECFPDVRVEVIDSRQTAMCYGWMAIEAARAAQACPECGRRTGQTLAEIVTLVKGMIPRARMIMTADTLKYLYMGGRIGRAKHLVGSLLNLKPLISMDDGVIVALGQARSRCKAYQRMVEIMAEMSDKLTEFKVAITHVAALEEAEKLKTMVAERLRCQELLIAELSPALGVHTGPGTVGICFIKMG